jgi:hypothetical protein
MWVSVATASAVVVMVCIYVKVESYVELTSRQANTFGNGMCAFKHTIHVAFLVECLYANAWA